MQNNIVMDNDQTDLAQYLALLLQKYPDLERIVTTWPDLPEPVKAGILAMIQAAK